MQKETLSSGWLIRPGSFFIDWKKKAEFYLDKRQEQGFNVIQAVVLAELDGIYTPNTKAELPFSNLETWEYNEAYFSHVDLVLDLALERDLHVALLPTRGDKLFKNTWGIGPEIFTPEKTYSYGKWIGNRYRNRKNLIWVLGGDRNPRENSDDSEVWNQMAKGILESQNSENKILITFHPQSMAPGGSSVWFHQAEWLDFNMHQTGHCPNYPSYSRISYDYGLTPTKPTIDGEPMYEEHPKCFNARVLGFSEAADIQRIMYWNVFAQVVQAKPTTVMPDGRCTIWTRTRSMPHSNLGINPLTSKRILDRVD